MITTWIVFLEGGEGPVSWKAKNHHLFSYVFACYRAH